MKINIPVLYEVLSNKFGIGQFSININHPQELYEPSYPKHAKLLLLCIVNTQFNNYSSKYLSSKNILQSGVYSYAVISCSIASDVLFYNYILDKQCLEPYPIPFGSMLNKNFFPINSSQQFIHKVVKIISLEIDEYQVEKIHVPGMYNLDELLFNTKWFPNIVFSCY
jgi:hypothetical protein